MLVLIWLAAFIEGLSLTLIQGFLPLYVRRALGEPSFVTIGAVVAVPALGTILASNFWGGLSDVTGRLKPFILVGLLGYAIALAGLPLFHSGSFILAFVGLASLFFGTHAPSLKTYVTLAKPDRREHALAYLLMFQSIGWLVGSMGGERFLENGLGPGFRLALAICASLAAAYTLVLAIWLRDQRHRPAPPPGVPAPPPEVPAPPASRGWLAGLWADLVSLYENPRLLRLCVLTFFIVAGNYTMWGFFTVFFTEHLHAGMRLLGWALALSSVLGIASFFYVGPLVRRFGGAGVIAVGSTLYMLMYLGISLSRDPTAVAVLFALPLYGMINVSTNALVAEYSSAEQRGGGLGVLNGTYALATIVGPLTGGFLADRIGLGAIPWTALGFLACATPIAWRALLSARTVRVPGRNAD